MDPAPARRRVAYLTFGTGLYDARTLRMARTAQAAGYDVRIYARWYPGLPPVEERDGFTIVRVPSNWKLAVPFLRRRTRARLAARVRAAARTQGADAGARAGAGDEDGGGGTTPATTPDTTQRAGPVRAIRGFGRRVLRPWRDWKQLLFQFPLRGLGWAAALEEQAEPADIWHGMWAGSLPALVRLRDRDRARAIYDSRDIYMESRGQASARWPTRNVLAALERRWAREVDAVLTVNDAYARELETRLGVARPPVVMNLSARWTPPEPVPDLIRAATGLPASTRIVLYQGGLMTDRGIEQCLEAILEVPDAAFALLGFGALRKRLGELAGEAPYAGRVFLLDPVPPSELLAWTASADVSVMLIQPTSLNHRLTTPQKLFESIAAGVPVVASDLPGMADIVRDGDAGIVCDPRSPREIAAALRALLDVDEATRAARRERILALAHGRYNWEAEEPVLLGLYERLLAG